MRREMIRENVKKRLLLFDISFLLSFKIEASFEN